MCCTSRVTHTRNRDHALTVVSVNVTPVASDFFTRSEPARSTKFNLPCAIGTPSALRVSTVNVRMACARDDDSLRATAPRAHVRH
jgi:hypothetical protein